MKTFLRALGMTAGGAMLGFAIFVGVALWSAGDLAENERPGPTGFASLVVAGSGSGALSGLLAALLVPRKT